MFLLCWLVMAMAPPRDLGGEDGDLKDLLKEKTTSDDMASSLEESRRSQ